MNEKLKYIDLFAGIGGFHIALSNLGHECVFASELSNELRNLYFTNYGIKCEGDITKINIGSIPSHDILCAGFPCQTFSKAGKQKGLYDVRGKLFDEIIKILKFHKPRYFILENVRNLLTHNKCITWNYIEDNLNNLGYTVDKRILSPHLINIPHHRERVFVVGSLIKSDIEGIKWIEKESYHTSIDIIINSEIESSNLETEKIHVLNVWEQFLKDLPINVIPYSPLWFMEYKANYPENVDWQTLTLNEWQKYKGSFGYPLNKCKNLQDVFYHLPNYVKTQKGIPPKWKQNYINKNRIFLKNNLNFISKETVNSIKKFKSESWKKLEWNCLTSSKTISDKLIQFRGSGVRVKKSDFLPSLVTVSTQIPIIGKYKRYLLPEEGAKSQSLPNNIKLPESNIAAFRVLGNMVNVELVSRIANSLINKNN